MSWAWLTFLLFGPNLIAYLIHQALLGYFFKARDLKRRYNATWALVTGASSGKRVHSYHCLFDSAKVSDLWETPCAGIGKAVATKLADQGLNVVLVAKPDDLLDATYAELQEVYPKLQFRKVMSIITGCTGAARSAHHDLVHAGSSESRGAGCLPQTHY